MYKTLITGVGGQLGSEIFRNSKYETYGTYLITKPEISNQNLVKIDLAEKDKVISLIGDIKPDCIIHCAAVSSVEACETDREGCWRSNVIATKNIVDACLKFGSKIVFISTDYVFDGKKGNYREDDAPNPVNFYGMTKLIGEWLTKYLPDYVVIRTALLLSNNPRSFATDILNKLKSGELSVAKDMRCSPTLVSELSDAIISLIEYDARGIFHLTGESKVSRYEVVKKLASVFGYDENIVKPIIMKNINFKAPRPLDTTLDISKAKQYGLKLSNLDEIIDKLKS